MRLAARYTIRERRRRLVIVVGGFDSGGYVTIVVAASSCPWNGFDLYISSSASQLRPSTSSKRAWLSVPLPPAHCSTLVCNSCKTPAQSDPHYPQK